MWPSSAGVDVGRLLPPLALAYLIGSLPFSYWVARWSGVDVRQAGSRNVGATNVARTVGVAAGACALVLDAAKGFLAAMIGTWWQAPGWVVSWSVVAAVIGHTYPVWLRFRGGKGAATAAGGLLFLLPQATVMAIGVFLVVVIVTRLVSLASILLLSSAVAFGIAFSTPAEKLVPAVALAIIVTWHHRSNIARLRQGTEVRIEISQKAREVPE